MFLIDTPGFDDTHRSDTDVLTDVAHFLSASYQEHILLTGIIYLHRITDPRMSGSALKNLKMFQKLCGENYFQNVVLATTMWGNLHGKGLTLDTGIARERELVEKPQFWGAMYQRRSRVMRHTGNKESAEGIISYLMSLHSRPVLTIQDEMVNQRKKVGDTAAGMEVEKELQAVKAQNRKDIAELQRNHEDAMRNRDEELAKVIKAEQKRCEDVLAKANEDTERLQADFGKLKKDKDDQIQQLQTEFKNHKEDSEKKVKEYGQKLKSYEANHKKNEKKLKEMQAEYQRLLEESQQYRESETSVSGMATMLIGVGMTAFSAVTFNPLGVAAGVGLYSAGADRVAAKEAAAQAMAPRGKNGPKRKDIEDD